MRKIVDQNIYNEQVSVYNKDLARDFLIEKRSQGKTENTLKTYTGDMRVINFLVWKHFDNKPLIELNRKDIRNLFVIFQNMGMSNARANGLMCCLRSCLEFAADDDDYNYEFNIGSRVKGLPKEAVRQITFLSENQINWLLDELLKKEEYLYAMYLALSYYSAGRKTEIYQTLKEGLTERHCTNVVIGKRRKKFKLFFNERTRQIIQLYLNARGKDLIPQLFVKLYKNGRRDLVHKATFNYWCEIFSRMLSEKEGKPIRINPHCFRHSRLENLSRKGIPLEKLKSLANHSDISTTESYLADRSEDDIAEIFALDASSM